MREPLLQLGAEEIDTCDVSDEQGASTEQVLRIIGAAHVADEKGDVLRSVAGRCDAPHAQRADVETGAVAQREMRVLDVRMRTRDDGDRPQLGKSARPRQVVVMDVGLE